MSINKMMISPKRFELLKTALEETYSRPGYVVEFGVGSGNSFRRLAGMSKRKVFGFDSFKGIPENWAITDHVIFAAGSFKYDPPSPPPNNSELVAGWFHETIPEWKKQHAGPMAFIHIDSDIYSSCWTILNLLNDRIIPGTVIVFDEMYNYDNWREGEWKALKEWCELYGRKTHEIRTNHTQAAHRVIV